MNPPRSLEPTTTMTEISQSPPKSKSKDPSPERMLPKLDITSTVPKYEPRAPEDPTPTATSEDIDPLSVQRPVGNSASNVDKVGTVTTPVREDDEEEEVTSPSGGSIRTGGSDVLKAILGHIHDYDDVESGNQDDKTQARAELPAKSDGKKEGKEKGAAELEAASRVTGINDEVAEGDGDRDRGKTEAETQEGQEAKAEAEAAAQEKDEITKDE